MDILIKDSIQGEERKILIADVWDSRVKEIENSAQISDKAQTMEYINACRAIFKTGQAMKRPDALSVEPPGASLVRAASIQRGDSGDAGGR